MSQRILVVASLRAAVSLALLAGFGGVAMADVPALIGGDVVSGDQATVALDADVPAAFSYTRSSASSNIATAYFNWHLFCAETPRTGSAVTLNPRYQLPPSAGGDDVWKFPSVYVHDLAYQGSGSQNTGAPALRIGNSTVAGQPQYRCLSALPGGSSLQPWYANHGLFGNGFGDYVGASNTAPNTPPPRTPPSGPHQNVKVTAQTFSGFAGRAVSVVKVEMQFDTTQPANTEWTLVDAYNTEALSPVATGANPDSDKATWCLLKPDWVGGTTPPAALCDDASIRFPGLVKETGGFVSRNMGFQTTFAGPFYVLVSRLTNGTATAGTPVQGFAALRTGGGMTGVAEEMQDWYTDDSVWYNY